MAHMIRIICLIAFLPLMFISQQVSGQEKNNEIIRYDRPDASILKGVYIPEGKEYFYTSGLVAPVLDQNAEQGSYDRYGNTYEQSIGILNRIKETLAEAKFKMEDVIFLRVYLAPDKDGKIDWDAWFKAYGEFFNNPENSNKVARSTIAVHSLANPALLIEVEAVAAR
ncbi:MAG TPA: RidA family protein [Anditalea sp.]|nr:RidA family protein [Anditalea sp.]